MELLVEPQIPNNDLIVVEMGFGSDPTSASQPTKVHHQNSFEMKNRSITD